MKNIARKSMVRGLSTLGLILVIVLILLLVGAFPGTGLHSYGYGPFGLLGIVLIILLVLVVTGRL
jgi:Protein of unknown function (DUF3309).